jgi:hypothetical protein
MLRSCYALTTQDRSPGAKTHKALTLRALCVLSRSWMSVLILLKQLSPDGILAPLRGDAPVLQWPVYVVLLDLAHITHTQPLFECHNRLIRAVARAIDGRQQKRQS